MTMQEIVFLGPNGTLGTDNHQWILCREGKSVSFVCLTKAVLARCIREKGIELSPEGKVALMPSGDDLIPGGPIRPGEVLR